MVLLIDDDAGQLAAIRRLLSREGREVRVASTVSDAVAAFLGPLPSLILLSPGIESGRGQFVLEEHATRRELRAVPVLLLGAGVPGFEHPVASLPPGEELVARVNALAPLPAVELLSSAERALARARDEAAARQSAAQQTTAELSEQLAAVQARLDAELAAARKMVEAHSELEQKLEALQREHGQTQDALSGLSREHAEAVSRRDALKAKLDAALERAQQRSEAAAAAEGKLAGLEGVSAERDRLSERVQQLEAELAQASAKLADEAGRSRKELEAELSATAAKLEDHAGRARRQLETAREAHRIELSALKARIAELEVELDLAETDAETVLQERTRGHDEALAALQVQLDGARAAAKLDLDGARAEHDERLAAARTAFEAARADQDAKHAAELQERGQRLAELQAQHEAVRAAQAKAHEEQLAALEEQRQAALASLRAELEAARTQHEGELHAARAEAERSAAAHAAELAALKADRDAWSSAVSTASAELADERSRLEEALAATEAARLELQAAKARLAAAEGALASERERADAAEAREAEALERVRAMESRTHLLAEVEDDAPPLAIPRTGTVGMGELARLVVQLWAVRADVRLDLSSGSATRRLWLRRGGLVAAWSSLKAESITSRARRDGLIDGHQEAELREVRDASAASLLEELRQRGLIRRSEVESLVQRFTEEIALEALSEAVCTYRLHDEPPGAEVVVCEPTRLLPALAAQALKRSLPWEAQLELLGGSQAVPSRLRAPLGAEALGLTGKESALLDAIDGSTRIETLIVESGLKTERGYQVLAVAKVTGLIAVGPPLEPAPEPAPADPDSLDAKYEQVQQTDYFGILGLPRSAGAADVRAARERLTKQFDPLKWTAHPDPSLLRRAQAVFSSIEEAAKTLQDDRLRAEYARHLD